MRILLLGKNGQVGRELQRALASVGEVFAPDRKNDPARWCGDVTDYRAIGQTIAALRPDVVVNASAYTAVDKAESDREAADRVNHLAVANLAAGCAQEGALLVHYSTDYVFDGEGSLPWREIDAAAPINFYGFSKREGEVSLEKSGAPFLNFRTSWVYGLYGMNFIRAMLKLGHEREELKIVSDQIGVPTDAALIADVTAHSLQIWMRSSAEERLQLTGHYHLAAAGETNWYEYARYIFEVARLQEMPLKIRSIIPITTEEYPTPAKRPLNSRLATEKIRNTFVIDFPDWQTGVGKVVRTLSETMK